MSKFEVYGYEFLPDPPLGCNGVNRVSFQCTYNYAYPTPDLSRTALSGSPQTQNQKGSVLIDWRTFTTGGMFRVYGTEQ
ncbi:hypothetical protein ARMGADRAFT_1077762 [Armillaria gallica]|uniref:Uncharacterized protein n=1 Tax=Armillaria gallica TaxID=47427 RepID=A0A2H3DQD1_ARMGA|nr:hypothetical protein ARMGADRAFT_1077762 [Armillaria gallica]